MLEPSRQLSFRERFNISRLAIQYRWVTLSFWMAIAVAGILAFSSLKYALFPEITFPVVVVNASAPLKTAVDTEQKLTKPIEQKLQRLQDATVIDSTTYPGRALVRVQFEVGSALEQSSRDVETALKDLQLPQGATSKIIPINLNEAAVVSYVVESKSRTLEQLVQVTKEAILPAIAKVPGVLRVDLLGEPTQFDLTKLTHPKEGLAQVGTIVRFNGRRALAFQVVKQEDANTLEVARQVDRTVKQLPIEFPDINMSLAATQATYIQAATNSTIDALIEAIVLAIVVIFPFLRSWRATAISALAIPISLLGTFIVMAIYKFNLETITLLALAMIVGSVVDDAIVDVENISRHIEEGQPPRQAAITATNEIGLSVTAASLTVVAVFLPVGMMGGVLGQFFKPFGITTSAATVVSLLVARTLSPLLAASWLKPLHTNKAAESKPSHLLPNWTLGLARHYRNLLHWSLEHRWFVVAISAISFAIGLALIPLIPKGFIPKLDRGEFNITYTAPQPKIPPELLAIQPTAQGATGPNLSQPVSSGQIRNKQRPLPQLPPFNPLEDSLEAAAKLDEYVLKSPQVATVFTVVGSRQGEPNKGSIYVKMKSNRTVTTADLQDQFRRELPQPSGVTTSVEDIQFVDTGGEKPVQIRIVGENLTSLNQAAQDVKAELEQIPGLEDISSTADSNQDGKILEIQHSNSQRIASINANLGQNLTIGAANDRATAAARSVLPPDISLKLAGDSARVNEILGSFASTLALSVLCILLVLLLLFRNWLDTLVIFLSLPLSIVGAMLGLLIAQSDFGMISLIGIIFLLGLTNKNAILIVDYIKQLRRSGLNRKDAILEAVPVRLRPILMTSASTILGMLPLAWGLGAGFELRAPMAIAIMGGLITSTLLSLLVVPIIYDLLDDWRSSFAKVK